MEKNLELLYKGALADGTLSKKEIEVLIKRAEESGEDMLSFKKKLLEDAITLEFKNGGSVNSKEKILSFVKILNFDVEEYSILLDGYIAASAKEDSQGGKEFIQKLKNKIEHTAIYEPTGKYGKMELNRTETAEEKANIVLLASPHTPSEIYEYVVFADSLNFKEYKKLRTKIKVLISTAKKDYPNSTQLLEAEKVFKKGIHAYQRKAAWNLGWRILVCVLSIGVYFGFFWMDFHWGWKILWGILAIYPAFGLGVGPLTFFDMKEKKKLSKEFMN